VLDKCEELLVRAANPVVRRSAFHSYQGCERPVLQPGSQPPQEVDVPLVRFGKEPNRVTRRHLFVLAAQIDLDVFFDPRLEIDHDLEMDLTDVSQLAAVGHPKVGLPEPAGWAVNLRLATPPVVEAHLDEPLGLQIGGHPFVHGRLERSDRWRRSIGDIAVDPVEGVPDPLDYLALELSCQGG
jgi:hypothetical protein